MKISAKHLDLDLNQRIYGGTIVDIDEYPFMVGLVYDDEIRCGASLVSKELLLSAAHCILQDKLTIPDFALINCLTNEFRLDQEGCERIPIEEVLPFPKYDKQDNSFDIALLKLSYPSKNIPISLGMFIPPEHEELVTMGWGKTEKSPSGSSNLLETTIRMVNRSYCNDQYRKGLSVINNININDIDSIVIDESMLCAAKSGSDACEGDSGGPLIILCDNDVNYIQLGIVSFGIGCSISGFPGVYSNIAHSEITDFIKQTASMFSQNITLISDISSCERILDSSQDMSPTAYPTFPPEWVCDYRFFDASDGCDCECGLQDPDCEKENQHVLNCGEEELFCIDGKCVIDIPESQDYESFNKSFYALGAVALLFCFIFGYFSIKVYSRRCRDSDTEVEHYVLRKEDSKRPFEKFTKEELVLHAEYDL